MWVQIDSSRWLLDDWNCDISSKEGNVISSSNHNMELNNNGNTILREKTNGDLKLRMD